MFIANNRASFHVRWKDNLVKHQKFSKYFDDDCLQNFLFFLSLLTAPIVKNSYILDGIYFVFLKRRPRPNWKSFKIQFRP